MISRSLFAAVLLASTALAGPPLTTIQDVLYKADGTRFAGTLTISWTSFEAIDKSAIATQVTTVTVTDGNLRVQLVPTTTAVPAANYTVKYNSDGRIQFSETWAVPSSVGPLRVRDVRIASTQAGVSAVTAVTTVQESDVFGLAADLGARPLKGPGYAAGRVAVVNPSGSLESATGSPSDCVRVDGSSGSCGGAQPSFVDGDSPSGIVDGANTTFTLSAVPNPASSLAVFRNGVLQKLVQDYNVTGNSVQFVAAAAPQPGDTLLASYRLTGGDTGTAQQGMVSPQQIDPAGLTAGQAWLWNGSSYVPGNVGSGGVDSTGSYSNPAWIVSLAFAKITGVPSFEPAIQAGTTGQYWRWDKSWQTLNAAAVANAADTTISYSDPAWLTISKAKVGLGNVENTALSSWAGTSSLTTIGTLAAGTVPWVRLSGVPATFAPAPHAGTHQAAGADPVTPASIGAAPLANPVFTGNVSVGTPLPATAPPAGSINFAGNLYQNGTLFSGGSGGLPAGCASDGANGIACTGALTGSALNSTGAGPSSVTLNGATSGTSTLQAPATGGGTSTLPAGTGTLLYSTGNAATATALSGLPADATKYYNGAGAFTVPAGGGGSSPLTAKGDLNTFSTVNTRLPVGADGQVPVADSTQTTGLKWATLPSEPVNGVNAQTANYTILGTDAGIVVTFNGASLIATLPASPPSPAWYVLLQNLNASPLTVARNGLTINGAAANIALGQNQRTACVTDGANWICNVPGTSGTGDVLGPATNTTGFLPVWNGANSKTLANGIDPATLMTTATAATLAQLPAAMKVRTCEIAIGDPGAASVALADDNDSPAVCGNKTGATLTITAVECYANAGTPAINPIITGGAAILTGPLTCGTGSFASGTLSITSQTNGQSIDANIATAGGTAKYILIRFTRSL